MMIQKFIKSRKGILLPMLLMGAKITLASGSDLPFASDMDEWLGYATWMGGAVMGIGLVGTVLMLINGGGQGVAIKGGGIVLGGLVISEIEWIIENLGLGGVNF